MKSITLVRLNGTCNSNRLYRTNNRLNFVKNYLFWIENKKYDFVEH